MIKRAILTTATLVACAALVLFTIGIYPLLYNYFIFPLGRLKQSISIGDPYAEVREKFDAYLRDHEDEGELYFAFGPPVSRLVKDSSPEMDYLFLYHVNVFDDVQLHVQFSHEGRVSEIVFIGD